MALNSYQQEAYDCTVNECENIVVVGASGTGKTYLLRRIAADVARIPRDVHYYSLTSLDETLRCDSIHPDDALLHTNLAIFDDVGHLDAKQMRIVQQFAAIVGAKQYVIACTSYTKGVRNIEVFYLH